MPRTLQGLNLGAASTRIFYNSHKLPLCNVFVRSFVKIEWFIKSETYMYMHIKCLHDYVASIY